MRKIKINVFLYIGIVAIFFGTPFLYAAEEQSEHHLDGTSMDFFYQNGTAISINFYDAKLQYEWIAGPPKGNTGKDIPYQSRKIGNEMYIVNFHEKNKPDFVTLVFNLEQNVMYSSAILRYGTESENTSFNGGIIQNVNR